MYKKILSRDGNAVENMVQRINDGACIPFDPANTDYQAYLKWISEGNIPEPPN